MFLGHPVYALGSVLFSIVLSTGIGSLLSERFAPSGPAGLLLWLSALVAYLFSLPLWLSLATHPSLEAAGLLARAAVSVAVVLPVGVLMGFGFPTGMRLAAAHDARPTPWLWGVNGAAGVLAAGLAVVCSIGVSINATIRVGAARYLLLAPVAVLLLKGPHAPRSRRAVA